MRLSTRLLVVLLPTAAIIMLFFAVWAVEQREDTLVRVAESETRAYTAAVALAFEQALHDRRFEEVQGILNELSQEPRIYGVLLYGPDARPIMLSEGLADVDAAARSRVRRVLDTATTQDLHRQLGAREVYSVLRPIHGQDGAVSGVLEVAQPLAFVEAEKTRTGQRFLLNTLILVIVLAGLTVWLVNEFVDRPLQQLVAAIRKLSWEDLSNRVSEESPGELRELAVEFNALAERLESARAALFRETEERIALEQRIQEAEKLAAFGTLAAGIAHQIAAPLNVIGGRAKVLGRRPIDDELIARNLRIIESEIDRISTVVRNLLDFARRPEPDVRTVDLLPIIQRVRDLLEGELEQGDIDFECAETRPVWVRADSDLLQEVMVILFMNALQAVLETEGTRVIEVDVIREPEEVTIEVTDTGPGIPERALPHVFDPFFTTKEGGTGLGLTVARNILEQLGGHVEARNRSTSPPEEMTEDAKTFTNGSPVRGAVVRFTLPRAEPAPANV